MTERFMLPSVGLPYFLDEREPAFLLSRAIWHVAELALLDCQFGVLSQNAALLKCEVQALGRALDTYSVMQCIGWYRVMDLRWNKVCGRARLHECHQKEFDHRSSLLQSLENVEITLETLDRLKLWKASIVQLRLRESAILLPFESRTRPEISAKILANCGNDFEFFLGFIFSKLELHHKLNDAATLALQLQGCVERCSALEQQRLLPVIRASISSSLLSRLESIGFRSGPVQSNVKSEMKLMRTLSRKLSRHSSSIKSDLGLDPTEWMVTNGTD